jgi:hypothetical protein
MIEGVPAMLSAQRSRKAWRDDLAGQQFGSWLVVALSHRNERGELYWRCICQCGAHQPVRANVLRSGKSTSCGCQTVYTQTTWDVWNTMLERCLNERWPEYHRYGGRGIEVSPRWQARFENFLEDMGERPEGMTLGRDDPNGHYVRSNCRWMTPRELRLLRREVPLWLTS